VVSVGFWQQPLARSGAPGYLSLKLLLLSRFAGKARTGTVHDTTR
jgi:hypothetical protein